MSTPAGGKTTDEPLPRCMKEVGVLGREVIVDNAVLLTGEVSSLVQVPIGERASQLAFMTISATCF